MNFKKFYINGSKFSVYISYGTKTYHFAFEGKWNYLMSELTLFTTRRYVIEKEGKFYVIYYKFYFKKTFIEKWEDKEKAIERRKELTKQLKEK
jgi:hypothetical protein